MMTPSFYIFGTPEGFDMLDGTIQDVSCFQRFYDGSKEDTKFSIHRTAQGSVSYVFLKYNLSSYGSRTGAFFGMSLVFDDEFCVAPLQLYKLFDYVYHKHVLYHDDSNKGLLKTISGSEVKAQFLISRFEERREQIQFVEKVLLVNLKKNDILSNAFYPLGPGFKNDNQNLLVKLAMDGASDEKIVNKCRNYNYVTISPDWTEPPLEPEISPQVIMHWKDLTSEYRRFIIFGLGSLNSVDKSEVKKYQNQTGGILSQLRNNRYNKNIAPNIETDYGEINEQLADLYQKAVDAQSSGGGQTNPPPPPDFVPPTPPPTPSFWDNVKEWVGENKSKVAGIAGVAVLVVVLVLLRPKGVPGHEQYCCVEDVTIAFNKQLENEDFASMELDTVNKKHPTEAGRVFKQSLERQLDSAIWCQTKRIDSSVLDAIQNKDWMMAFQYYNSYYKPDQKTIPSNCVQDSCDAYFGKEIAKLAGLSKGNYNSKSKSLKKELDKLREKNYLDDNKYDVFISEINNNGPKDNEPVQSNYTVQLWIAESLTDQATIFDHHKDRPNSMEIHSSQEIPVKRGSGITFLLLSNGRAIELPLSGLKDSSKICTSTAKDWIDIRDIQNDSEITIKQAKINISFKVTE